MHWVDRGSEPAELNDIRDRYTQKWIDYYRFGKGGAPTDAYWRNFSEILRDRLAGLCVYCEGIARGEVDHFRPKSKFPELVYTWSNWLFACHDCNRAKGSLWPPYDYIDPCATDIEDPPERFFGFDLETGSVVISHGLSEEEKLRARTMIADLGLNDRHHLRRRLSRLILVVALVDGDDDAVSSVECSWSRRVVERDQEYSSFLRAALAVREL